MVEGFEIIHTYTNDNNKVSQVYKVMLKKTKEIYAMKIIRGIKTPLHKVIFDREVGSLNKLRSCI